MKDILLIITLVFLCGLVMSPAQGLVGSERTNFSTDGYETILSISYTGDKTLNLIEGGTGGGSPLYSLMTVKLYDDTINYPYVEIWDDDYIVYNFTMYEKEVARIWVNGSNGTDTLILITDMLGDKSAWINFVDYTCPGTDDIRQFWVYKEGGGFPTALIFSWLEDCEQLIVPIYTHKFPL